MAREGSAALVVRNTLANGLGTFSVVVISLVLTPFLINGLGLEAYGVFALALSLSVLGGYASMADLGIEASAARYIAEARSDGDTRAEQETASTAMAFFCVVAAIAAPALAGLSVPLVDVFGVDESLRSAAIACFALIAGQLVFELPARVYFAALEGAQRYGIYQVIELVRALAQAALFIVVLVADLGVAGLGGAVMASSVVVLVLSWAMTRRALPELRIARRHVSRARLRVLFTFGGQYFFIRLMGTIYRNIDKAIVGIGLGVRSVTLYEVANRIHQGASMVQSVAASSLLPATAYLRQHKEILRDLYLRGTNYTLAAAVPVTVAAFILAEPLIRTWIGDAVTGAAGPARLFLTFLVLVAVHAVGTSMIIALGRMRFAIKQMIVFTLTNVGISIALVGPLGVEGVILGTIAAQCVIWLPYTLFFLREFEVSWSQWTRAVLLPNLPGPVVQAATAYPLLYLADRTSSLIAVALLALLSVALSLAAYLLVGLRSADRAELFRTLRNAIGPSEDEKETKPDASVPPGHYEAEVERIASGSDAPPSPGTAQP